MAKGSPGYPEARLTPWDELAFRPNPGDSPEKCTAPVITHHNEQETKGCEGER